MKNVLFLCDASKEVGLGHLTRCLALAFEFSKKSCNVAFATKTPEARRLIENKHYPVFEKNKQNYKEWLKSLILSFKVDILILDIRDDLDKTTLIELKQLFNITIATIDDPTDKRLSCDYAFYPPLEQIKKAKWENFKGKLFIGFEWVILRSQFLEYYSEKKYPNTPVKILVSAGGSDPKGITLIIAKSLNKLKVPFEALIVLGGFFKWDKELSDILKSVNYRYILLKDVENMASIMGQCDFAIISFGTSAYELAFLGIPAIYLCISQDHSTSASMFEKKGCAINLGLYKNTNEEEIAQVALQLVQNSDLRIGMSKKAKDLIDGLGAKRIVEVLLG